MSTGLTDTALFVPQLKRLTKQGKKQLRRLDKLQIAPRIYPTDHLAKAGVSVTSGGMVIRVLTSHHPCLDLRGCHRKAAFSIERWSDVVLLCCDHAKEIVCAEMEWARE